MIERDVLPGWARTGCLAACILLGLGITGCRTAPLGDGATNSDAGVAARIERAGERTDLEESLDPTWIPTRADYDRRGTSGSPWIATAEPAPKGGGASGGGGGDLAKQAQNPIASLISLPLQNNTSFGIGPEDRTQNVLNFQPVYPVTLGKGWTLVNRAIIPIVHQPDVTSTSRAWDGLGDINLTTVRRRAADGERHDRRRAGRSLSHGIRLPPRGKTVGTWPVGHRGRHAREVGPGRAREQRLVARRRR